MGPKSEFDTVKCYLNMDELEESLRQVGWKPAIERLADQAAAEYAAYIKSLPVLKA